ncbi:MAG: hypothetical protein OHK0023_03930 [Anaerolineae bacterium]
MTRSLLSRDFLNERLVPDLEADTVQYFDHLRRYLYAQQFVAGKQVLDIACGTGYGMQILHQGHAARVIGADLSAAALRYAQTRYKLAALLQADGMYLPLPSSALEVVVSFETLEHLPEPRRFLAEIQRVLCSNGLLILSTPNRAAVSPNSVVPFSPYHQFEPTLPEFKALLEGHGWQIVELLGLTHSAHTAHLSTPTQAPYTRTSARHVAFMAYLRRAIRDFLPPILYRRLTTWRNITPLSLADSVLVSPADDKSAYFVARCVKV